MWSHFSKYYTWLERTTKINNLLSYQFFFKASGIMKYVKNQMSCVSKYQAKNLCICCCFSHLCAVDGSTERTRNECSGRSGPSPSQQPHLRLSRERPQTAQDGWYTFHFHSDKNMWLIFQKHKKLQGNLCQPLHSGEGNLEMNWTYQIHIKKWH